MERDAEATRELFSGSTVSAPPAARRAAIARDSLYQRETASAGEPALGRRRAPASDPPTRIGRYRVERVIGEGGMGRVYKAHDPELDRVVALKVVRDHRVSSSFQLRMLREAQAMARLQHANVVTVHDVGLFEDRLYIAMDFIEGQTLSDWLKATPRSIEEILRAFLGAGAGLAAAHRVDLVHRDFKPSNVLVGADGVVRILDFGLVRSAGATDEDEASTVSLYSSDSALSESLTVTGAFMGTPAYMSPEQFMGVEADARSDQFSFCVALYEALYGQHPFTGSTVDELRDALLSERRSARPPRARVPRWLDAALERGLALNRERRWPSMDELLARLRVDPRRLRRRALGLTLALVTVGAAGYATATGLRPRACAGVEHALADIWNDGARGSLRAVFERAERTYEREQGPAIIDALDRYAVAWLSARARACEDHDQRVLSETRYNSATRCLERRRDALRAVVGALRDGHGVGEALTMVEGLPSIPDCADPTRLDVRYPPPRDPAQLERINQLQRRLAEVVVQMQTTSHQAALAEFNELGEAIEATGYVPLFLEFSLAMREAPAPVKAMQENKELPTRVLSLALESSDDEAAVAALTMLSKQRDRSPAELEGHLKIARPLAEALLDRAGLRGRMVTVRYYAAQAGVEYLRGRDDATLAYAERAATLAARAEDASWTDRVKVWSKAAELFQVKNEYERADPLIEASLAELPDPSLARHPVLALVYEFHGASLVHRGDIEGGLARLDLAIEVYRDGGVTRRELSAIRERAVLRERLGDVEGALEDLKLVVAQGPSADDNAPIYLNTHNSMAVVQDRLGRHREAVETIERALPLALKYLPEDHDLIRGARLTLADALLHAGDLEAARAEYRGVARTFAKSEREEHPLMVYARAGLGLVALAQGRDADARELLEDALARRLELGESPELIGETRFALARALESTDEDERARSLAAAALADFETAGPLFAEAGAEVKTWLEARGPDSAD